MKEYLNLIQHILDNGEKKQIELEPVPFQHLELKADMTLEMDFH